MAIKRILVPIDFSTHSLSGLAYARDFAERLGAELVILHVVEPTYFASALDVQMMDPAVANRLDEQWRACKAELERLAVGLQQTSPRFRTMMKRGAPAQSIVDTAKRSGADLIVMATYGHTGLAHMLIGSVAEKVVRSAHCPVLTIRSATKRRKKARKGS